MFRMIKFIFPISKGNEKENMERPIMARGGVGILKGESPF